MSKSPHPGSTNRFSKGLFAVVLLLGIFTFSGFVAQTQTVPLKQQTTLVAKSNARLVKRIGYYRASVPANFIQSQVSSYIILNRLHSYLVKIKIKAFPNSCSIFKAYLLYRVKALSPNAGDDPAILLG